MKDNEVKKGTYTLSWRRAVETLLNESVFSYLLRYVLGSAILGFTLYYILNLLIADLLGELQPILFLIPIFIISVSILYPKLIADRRRIKIDQAIPLFITSMGVLSTTNIPRIDVIETISEQEEYGPIADEMKKIVELVKTWNMSLDEAARFQSEITPSPLLRDFLERMAYNVSAGQGLEEFLRNEQEVVMSEYETMYMSVLEDMDVLKDLFISMTLSVAFIIVFATIIPILTGIDPNFLLFASIILYGLIEGMFLYGTYVKVPFDPVWYEYEDITYFDKKIIISIIASIAGVILLSILLALNLNHNLPIIGHIEMPLPLYFAIGITPMLLPGLLMRKEEAKIKKRDRAFPSFIRSLGSSESAKQTTTTKVLKTLQTKDFGDLTKEIRNLYKRLNLRIDQVRSWKNFAMETKSFLIQRFSEMYYKGRLKGGNPEKLGYIIGKNFNKILELRQHRKQTTSTFIGVIYGITASSVFAFFSGIEIVKLMIDIMEDVQMPDEDWIQQIIFTDVYNIPDVQILIMIFILVNAVMSSMMIKVVDGGHHINTYHHLVGLIWTGVIVAIITERLVSMFLTI
ncbi:Archaellum assembly protein J TadC family [Methanonatronarchaeum thermophilum]|uniref:Archaellum assembly protein J TadC family n=1 Tax=Methanonatronarchaeum thermophilum TaxID=1927129 RepID=A0A1Y3GAR9_9EURY|nr:archaellar assembly protein FlaJ [Methanonatronarchaeum thermophilum]OUJ18340.1 Archaellum assembly protein J TadC family [Methanonatronarchaeum thermophilum]